MRGYYKRNKAKYFLAGISLTIFISILMPSCTHESLILVDPNPIDTIDNPIDTIDNPNDTMGTPCDTNLVYFSRDILPLLKSNCAKSGCHDAITHQEDIILDNFQHVMGSDVIKPYDINDSELFDRITENDDDKRMPPPPKQKLSGDQISLIAKWILQGAKDLTCDEAAGQ